MEFGPYQIDHELGRGAFGRVYEAFHLTTRRRVAMKVLSADSDADSLARFKAEAAMTAELTHPNVVRVYEFAEAKGCPYLVMELLEGETLQQIIAGGKTPSLLAKLDILQQVAEALSYAHGRGVIHRDVKPSNIMVTPEQIAKVMDFGTAAIVSQNGTRRTQTGDVLGTILYMAPEVLDGGEAQQKSDLFAYGIVCYEFLTGEHPFRAEDAAKTMYRISSQQAAPMGELLQDCPDGLAALVGTMLQKDPELRIDSFEDVLLDLKPITQALQSKEAQAIFDAVPALVTDGDVAAAREAIRAVLALDPGHAQARDLRDSLRRREQERVLGARLQTLLTDARTLLEEKRIAEAIELLESAVKLDGSDSQVIQLLNEAKAVAEQARRVTRLLSRALWEQRLGNLESAQLKVEQASEIDPGNQEAVALSEELREQIRAAMELSRLQQQAERAVERMTAALAAGDLDAAKELSGEATVEFPRFRNIAEMAARISNALAERERQRARAAAVEEMEAYLAAGAAEQALTKADSAMAEFGHTAEFESGKTRAQEELNAREKFRLARANVEHLIAAGELDQAVEALHRGSDEFGEMFPVGELEQKLAFRRHDLELAAFAAQVRGLFDREDFEAAEQLLAEARCRWEEEETWRVLEREFRTRYMYGTVLLMAEQSRSSGNLEQARELSQGLLANAPDGRARSLFVAVEAEIKKAAADAHAQLPIADKVRLFLQGRNGRLALLAVAVLLVLLVWIVVYKARPHNRPQPQSPLHQQKIDVPKAPVSEPAAINPLGVAPPAGQGADDDEAEISKTVEAYAAAIRNRSEKGLVSVWPDISDVDLNLWRTAFHDTLAIDFQLRERSEARVNGMRAHLDCRRRIEKLYAENRAPYSDDGGIHILLRKLGNRWIITSVSAP